MQNDLFLKNYTCMYTMYTVKQHIVLKFFYSHPFLGCSVQKRISIHASSQRRFRWSLVCQLWLFYRNVGYRGKKKKGGGGWEALEKCPPRRSKPHIARTHPQTSCRGPTETIQATHCMHTSANFLRGGVHHNDCAKAPTGNWGGCTCKSTVL